MQKIKEEHPDFPNSNLEHYLRKLQREEYGAVIRYSEISNCYSFADPFYLVFAMVLYEETSGMKRPGRKPPQLEELEGLLRVIVEGRSYIVRKRKR